MGGVGGEVGEEVELVSGEEAELHPAEEVIHDGFGVADLLVAGPAGGLEAGVGELLGEDLEGDAVLEGEGDGGGEGVHQAGDGGAFLGHADEDFAGAAVGVEADGDVALVAGDAELVGDGGALGGEAVADGAWRLLGVEGVGVLAGGGLESADLGFELGDAVVLGFEDGVVGADLGEFLLGGGSRPAASFSSRTASRTSTVPAAMGVLVRESSTWAGGWGGDPTLCRRRRWPLAVDFLSVWARR